MNREPARFKRGILKWYNVVKGFGFIVPDDGGPDVFVHGSLFEMCGIRPVALMPILFQQAQIEKGQRATHLRMPPPDPTAQRGGTMRVSEAIRKLQRIEQQYGDLPFIGGYLTDNSGLRSVSVLDAEGCAVEAIGSEPAGVFLQ